MSRSLSVVGLPELGYDTVPADRRTRHVGLRKDDRNVEIGGYGHYPHSVAAAAGDGEREDKDGHRGVFDLNPTSLVFPREHAAAQEKGYDDGDDAKSGMHVSEDMAERYARNAAVGLLLTQTPSETGRKSVGHLAVTVDNCTARKDRNMASGSVSVGGSRHDEKAREVSRWELVLEELRS